LKEIDGSAVGYGPAPGAFWELAVQLCKLGGKADFEKMMTDKKVVVRCMGMYSLAQTDWVDRAVLLKSRLGGTARVTCFPGGCCGYNITEGQFAYRLLHNAGYLGSFVSGPVLWPRELLEMNVDLAEREDSPCQAEARAFLVKAVRIWLLGQDTAGEDSLFGLGPSVGRGGDRPTRSGLGPSTR